MTLNLSTNDWFVLGLSSLGAIWLAFIFGGIFEAISKWLYAKLEAMKAPDFVPEEWSM